MPVFAVFGHFLFKSYFYLSIGDYTGLVIGQIQGNRPIRSTVASDLDDVVVQAGVRVVSLFGDGKGARP